MRHHLKDTLIKAYGPMNIIWHPIVFQDESANFNEPWIFPYIIPMNRKDCKAAMPQYTMRNWWIKNNGIIDDDYYVTVDDDDMYEAGVFDAIKQMDADIVIISLKRGHQIPADAISIRQYPINTLIAHPDNVQRGEISSQQSIIKGKIFKAHLFDDSSQFGDGDMAVHHKKSGEQIAYRPELFALFNYYEPGRWNKPEISFGVLVNDMMRLNMVLRNSALDPSIPCHTIKMPESATKGLNKLLDIIETSGATVAVLTHQDMFYRQGWTEQVKEQLAKLPDNWIVAGIVGKDMAGKYAGKFHDMRTPLQFGSESDIFPIPASCFDESCIIVNMKKKFRFDEGLDGFDLYGTLCVLQTWEMGGTAWIINAFAEHYCMRPFTWYPDKTFEESFMFLHRRFPNAFRIDTTVIGVIRQDNPPRWDKTIEALAEQSAIHAKSLTAIDRDVTCEL
jgi:hypothetical protein